MCEDAPCCGCCGSNGMEVLGDEDFHALENQKDDDARDAATDDEDCDDEPRGSHDLSDDGDALASAGWGTDEDYGGCGGEDW